MVSHGMGKNRSVSSNGQAQRNFVKKTSYGIILIQRLLIFFILLLWLRFFAFSAIIFITMPSEDP